MEPTGDIALIGLAVMGQNLVLNMNDNGYTVVALQPHRFQVDEFLEWRRRGARTVSARTRSRDDRRCSSGRARSC